LRERRINFSSLLMLNGEDIPYVALSKEGRFPQLENSSSGTEK